VFSQLKHGMNRITYLFVGLALVIASVNAAIPSRVDIYFHYDEDYIAKIGPMPSQYKDRYQLPLDELIGSPTFKVISGKSANVSVTGLIRPDCTTWYYKGNTMSTAPMEGYERTRIDCTAGNTTIQITGGTSSNPYSYEVLVTVTEYAVKWASDEQDKILGQIITSGMTQREQYKAITDWVADNTDYCVNYSDSISMMVCRCGDCWASTYLIVSMAVKKGIDCWGRRANQQSGAGSGHRNAIAHIGNTYYIAEAGYTGTKPRGRSVYEEPMGVAISGMCIYQVDAKNDSVVIPSQVGDVPIRQLGNGNAYVFEHYPTALHLPASIQVIADGALLYTDTIETFTIDSGNTFYEAKNSVVYTKTNRTLMFIPKSRTSVSIDKNTLYIGYSVFADMKFNTFVIPGNVKGIDIYGFRSVQTNRITIENGVQYFGNSAFRYARIPRVVLPDSVTSIGQLVFYSSYIPIVVLSKNLKEVPRGTFRDSSVWKVIVPEGVQTLGEDCFYNCRNLNNITIPTSVTKFGSNVFTSVTKTIYYRGTQAQWNKIFFNTTIPSSIQVVFNSPADTLPPEEPVSSSSSYKPHDPTTSSSHKPHDPTTSSSHKPVDPSSHKSEASESKGSHEENVTKESVESIEENGEFPVWAVAVIAGVGGAALAAAAVIVAVVLVMKKKSSAPAGNPVEMQSVSVSSGNEAQYPGQPYSSQPQSPYAQAPRGRPAPPPPPRRY